MYRPGMLEFPEKSLIKVRDLEGAGLASEDRTGRVTFRRLKWLAILAPIGFIGVLEYTRYALAPVYSSWQGHLLLNAVVLLGAIFFYGAVFSVVDMFQNRLQQSSDELAAMHHAGLDILSELSLDAVLQKAVARARDLLRTRYGALAVYDQQGRIHQFVTSGIDGETARRIGTLPSGKGLLGIVLQEGQHLRVADIGTDPRGGGLPPHHPPMRSLLAVPVVCRSPFKGNLYVSEKLCGSLFTEEDEEILTRLATQAAIAVDNADLYAQVESLAMTEERLRLAREMHDGQAQVLAFVNAKTQTIRELHRAGRPKETEEQLEQMAAVARKVYAEVREGILGLRAAVDSENALSDAVRQHVERWQDQCGIPVKLTLGELPRLRIEIELQLLRIVQESLANVRKHSGASRVDVTLSVDGDRLTAEVADDGKGFDPEDPGRGSRPRFGLATMRERAEAIGARFEISSDRGAGTRVTLELPMHDLNSLQTTFQRSPENGALAMGDD